MINHILLIFTTIVIYEFVNYIKLKILISSNFNVYQKLFNLFFIKNLSDLKKQKLILKYSKQLLIISTKIIIAFIFLFIFILSLNLLSSSFLESLISFSGLIECSIIFVIYYFIRKKLYG